MTPLLWVGFGFVGLLVVFLMLAFLLKNLTHDQRTILRFITALCAGFAGGLLTGEGLFNLSSNTDVVALSVTGGAGFGLFFTVWFTYRTILPDGITFALPDGWSFEAAVTRLASAHDMVATLEGFSAEQRSAPLRGQQIRAKSMKEALVAIGSLATLAAFPRYDVKKENSSTFRLTAKA